VYWYIISGKYTVQKKRFLYFTSDIVPVVEFRPSFFDVNLSHANGKVEKRHDIWHGCIDKFEHYA
jgi:hypothetical protein